MIEVIKGPEPDGLRQLREDPTVQRLPPKDAFQMLRNPLKAAVTECLKKDQGQLCVYCMSRIPREDRDPGIAGTTIEHYIPLDPADGRNTGQALDYRNLFAVCHGNTVLRKKGTRRTRSTEGLTCDKHRGNTEFRKIDPLRGETLESICYKMNGEIDASEPDAKYDLTVTLNLNSPTSPLIHERKAALDALLYDIGTVDEADLIQYCSALLNGFLDEKDPKTPYVGILTWYLRTMIAALPQ